MLHRATCWEVPDEKIGQLRITPCISKLTLTIRYRTFTLEKNYVYDLTLHTEYGTSDKASYSWNVLCQTSQQGRLGY